MVTLDTLSGFVRSTGGSPLADVTVRVGTDPDAPSALTNAEGAFILSSIGSLPVGTVVVEIDGSTAAATGAFPFPLLDIVVPLPAGTTDLLLPQVITLPDLNNPESANQSLALDAGGVALSEIAVVQQAGMSGIALEGPAGTTITVHGEPVMGGVDLNVTPVDPGEVPMPLPDGLQGNSFVTIQPGASAFDPPGPAAGLDITLPNDQNLPVGTLVDIWSFDHDEAQWVNRTEQTGQSGIVRTTGGVPGPTTEIFAAGVITEGGWHSGVVNVDPDCATRVQGRIVDGATLQGIPGATLAFSTGQFATADSNGDFLSGLIPAYDIALQASTGECMGATVDFEVVLPPSYGGLSSGTLQIAGNTIVTGGITVLDPIAFDLGTTGSVAGVVLGNFTAGDLVTLQPSQGAGQSAVVQANGSFFQTGLEAGSWVASFLFNGSGQPAEVPFSIQAGQTTTIAIQGGGGSGSGNVTVFVVHLDDFTQSQAAPLAEARVLLQGTDGGSAAGLVGVTDATGRVQFQGVSGPFNVTASYDFFNQGETTRVAASVLNHGAPGGEIGLALQPFLIPEPLVTDATLMGTVANLPALGADEDLRLNLWERNNPESFVGSFEVDPTTGAFTGPIPSGTDLQGHLHHSQFGLQGVVTRSVQLLANTGQVASGGTLTVNLDYADSAPFDQPVNLTFTNAPTDPFSTAGLLLEDSATGAFFTLTLYASLGAIQDQTVQFPDLDASMFAGYEARLFVSSGSNTATRPMATTPASTNLEFLTPLVAQNPTDGQQYTAAQLQDLLISFVEGGNGSFGSNGLNSLELSYSAETGQVPVGVDHVAWELDMPAGTQSFRLPPTPVEMLVDGNAQIYIEFGKSRAKGVVFDYEGFFNGSIGTNLETLFNSYTDLAQSYVEVIVSTVP